LTYLFLLPSFYSSHYNNNSLPCLSQSRLSTTKPTEMQMQPLLPPILLDSSHSFDASLSNSHSITLDFLPEEQICRYPVLAKRNRVYLRTRTSPSVTNTSFRGEIRSAPICDITDMNHAIQLSCPSISRKRRIDESRSRQSKRLCLSSGSWDLAPQLRFFDKANWLDEADKYFASKPEELCRWRDTYTLTISQTRLRSRSLRRRRRRPESSPYTLISLPVCPPLERPALCTPRGRTISSSFVYVEETSIGPSPAVSS
jgi:hypothetical protein